MQTDSGGQLSVVSWNRGNYAALWVKCKEFGFGFDGFLKNWSFTKPETVFLEAFYGIENC
jgi:hypothetical protein